MSDIAFRCRSWLVQHANRIFMRTGVTALETILVKRDIVRTLTAVGVAISFAVASVAIAQTTANPPAVSPGTGVSPSVAPPDGQPGTNAGLANPSKSRSALRVRRAATKARYKAWPVQLSDSTCRAASPPRCRKRRNASNAVGKEWKKD